MNTDGDMPSSHGVAGGGGVARSAELRCLGVLAEPERFPGLRRALAGWAEHVGMSAEQVEALAMASYEALANAAAHAYPGDTVGVLDVHAVHRLPTQVEVVVTDYGRWQPPLTERGAWGGRGLLLIESLAEHAEVTTAVCGTSVRMFWSVEPHTAAV